MLDVVYDELVVSLLLLLLLLLLFGLSEEFEPSFLVVPFNHEVRRILYM